MRIAEPFPPLCPITGLRAKRQIQRVSGALLIALCRASFGVSTARQLRDVKRFGLWEYSCRLGFFDPMIVGTCNSTPGGPHEILRMPNGTQPASRAHVCCPVNLLSTADKLMVPLIFLAASASCSRQSVPISRSQMVK